MGECNVCQQLHGLLRICMYLDDPLEFGTVTLNQVNFVSGIADLSSPTAYFTFPDSLS